MLDHVSITVSDIAAAERVLRRDHEGARRGQGRPPRRLAGLWRAGAAGLSGPRLHHHPQGTKAGRRLRPPLVLQGEVADPGRCRSGTPASRPAAPTTAPPGLRDYHASYYARVPARSRRQPRSRQSAITRSACVIAESMRALFATGRMNRVATSSRDASGRERLAQKPRALQPVAPRQIHRLGDADPNPDDESGLADARMQRERRLIQRQAAVRDR